jgi:excinuclease ABC subunit A
VTTDHVFSQPSVIARDEAIQLWNWITIELATPENAEELEAARKQARLETYTKKWQVSKKSIEEKFDAKKESNIEKVKDIIGWWRDILVVKDQWKIVWFKYSVWENQWRLNLWWVYLFNWYQWKWIGRKLMDLTLQWYENQDIYLHVVDYNVNAIKFYQEYGFEVVEWETETCTFASGETMGEICMVKKAAMDRHVVPPRDDENNIQRYNLAQLQKLPIRDLVQFLETYKETTTKPIQLIDRILWPLLERSQTIQNLWLAYINLARSMDTLSWWEIQRLRLAKQLGNKLTGIMYVLDEPTIGLDDDEIQRVITAIRSLKEMGNTIVVVEHNEEFIQSSDWVVEIGPGAGDFWGELVFSGPYPDFIKTDTLTAQYVTWRKEVKIKFDHLPSPYRLNITGAHEHNLKHIDTAVRLGSFTIITGPSGAGKTTLMYHTLYKFLEDRQKYVQWYIRLAMMQKGIAWKDILTSTAVRKEEYAEMETQAMVKFMEEIKVTDITGYDTVSNVIYVDQSSIGKTPRSCPATFIGVFDNIRKMFAGTQDAKILWFTDSYFSFNSDKWCCPECDGYGIKKVELQFLPDTYVPCTLCKGKRYKSEILTIRWHGKTINEILEMYVHEAHDFFSEIGFIEEELKIMVDIGLWYIKLGQAAHTLSWWESQRLKLVKHLLKQYKGHSIYFLDEPTVGLHPEDIQKLLYVLKHFLDRGDTILMIEHDKSLLQFADEVIRLKDGAVVKNWK